ncbi:MAG TPA: hypothetical protein VGD17_18720 [Chitinophagaceae bacterium]
MILNLTNALSGNIRCDFRNLTQRYFRVTIFVILAGHSAFTITY